MFKLSSASSIAALTITVIVPLYCLVITPGDTFAVYGLLYQLGTDLPSVARAIGGIPKPIYAMGWLLLTAAQMSATFLLTPRWWISSLQLIAAILAVLLYGIWHLVLVHLPMIKLFNDLS